MAAPRAKQIKFLVSREVHVPRIQLETLDRWVFKVTVGSFDDFSYFFMIFDNLLSRKHLATQQNGPPIWASGTIT